MPITTFIAEDLAPGFAVTSGPSTKRAQFLAALTGTVASYGFENKAVGQAAPQSFTLANSGGSLSVSVTGTGVVDDGSTFGGTGQFNTTAAGSKFWYASISAGTLTLNFASPIAAFGCYLTDLRDFGGTVTLRLTKSAGGTVDVPIAVTGGDANLAFVGIVDTVDTYSAAQFIVTGASASDFVGMDDVVAVASSQVIPVTNFLPGTSQAWPAGMAAI